MIILNNLDDFRKKCEQHYETTWFMAGAYVLYNGFIKYITLLLSKEEIKNNDFLKLREAENKSSLYKNISYIYFDTTLGVFIDKLKEMNIKYDVEIKDNMLQLFL